MIPANTQCSLLHRDGAALQNNMGSEQWYRQLFSSTVWQHSRFQHNCTWFHQWYLLGCKHPDKALQLLNLVNTDSKVRDWFYYGAEGKDFEYTDDNKVHRLTTDWGMAGYTQGTFFNVTQTDDVDFNQWDEVEELNEKATPSEMLGFNLDTSNIETELANCRAVYEKYYSELFTGAQDPRELVKTIDAELETAGWETIREEAQKQIDAQK